MEMAMMPDDCRGTAGRQASPHGARPRTPRTAAAQIEQPASPNKIQKEAIPREAFGPHAAQHAYGSGPANLGGLHMSTSLCAKGHGPKGGMAARARLVQGIAFVRGRREVDEARARVSGRGEGMIAS